MPRHQHGTCQQRLGTPPIDCLVLLIYVKIMLNYRLQLLACVPLQLKVTITTHMKNIG